MRSPPSRPRTAIAFALVAAVVALPMAIRSMPATAVIRSRPAPTLLAQLAFGLSVAVVAVLLHRGPVATARLPWARWSSDIVRSAVVSACFVGPALWRSDAGLGARLAPVMLLVFGPAMEELVFRAILPALLAATIAYPARRGMPTVIAVVCSLAFAAAHPWDDLRAFLISVGFGLLFHSMRSHDGGIESAIVAHAAVNAGVLRAMG